MGRRKYTADEIVDGNVYNIWDRCYMAQAEDLDVEDAPDGGIFDGLLVNGHSVDDVDPSKVPGWIDTLKEAEVHLRRKRLQLEALLADRVCATCGIPLAGRADRRYCSTRCRVAAHRAAEA